MKSPLSNMRRRVAQSGCGEQHQLSRVVFVQGDDPTPPWPEQDQGRRCSCGTELEYFTIIHQRLPESPQVTHGH